MKLQVLFFDGCPNHEALLPHLRALLTAAGAGDTDIELLRIEDAESAESERFLGSPTIRIDGEDVEPGADERTDVGLQCRLFATPDGLPADEWVLRALDRAAGPHDEVAPGAERRRAPRQSPAPSAATCTSWPAATPRAPGRQRIPTATYST